MAASKLVLEEEQGACDNATLSIILAAAVSSFQVQPSGVDKMQWIFVDRFCCWLLMVYDLQAHLFPLTHACFRPDGLSDSTILRQPISWTVAQLESNQYTYGLTRPSDIFYILRYICKFGPYRVDLIHRLLFVLHQLLNAIPATFQWPTCICVMHMYQHNKLRANIK